MEAAKRVICLYLLRAFGSLPVNVIGFRQVHDTLKPLHENKAATARVVRQHLYGILNWGIAMEYRPGPNPAAWSGPMGKLLPRLNARNVKHHRALPYQEIGAFMAELRDFRPKNRKGVRETGESLNALLLQFIILTAVRTREAREARWDEFDLHTGIWTRQPERAMAITKPVVYLSLPALQILKAMKARQAADGTACEYVFAYGPQDAPRLGQQRVGQSLTDETRLIKFLRNTLGRQDVTVHGFRYTFKSWQVDHFPNYEIASEMALGHTVGTEVRHIFARYATMIKQLRQLMDAWAEFCGCTEPARRQDPDASGEEGA